MPTCINTETTTLDDPISERSRRFAMLVIKGEFEKAAAFAGRPDLESSIMDSWTGLAANMLEKPHDAVVTVSMNPGEWQLPDPRLDDLGWRYVALMSPSDHEGLSLVWSGDMSNPFVSWMEWGRP